MSGEQSASQGAPMSQMASSLWCGFYAAGIIGMLVIYGLIQERIMTIPYGADAGGEGDVFSYSVFLVFCNRIAAVLFAIFMAFVKGESFALGAPAWKYLIVSLSNVFASTCQYESLKYVSFAVQMLGKSFKMMPVMLWGIVISQKRYGTRDWLVAAVVTLGSTEFLLTGPTTSSTAHASSAKGLILLLGFLALDGLTSTMQEKLFKEHKTTKYNQMMYTNGISGCVSIITLLGSRSLVPALGFCGQHGTFVRDAVALSASAVASQFFIYSQVKEFGALVFAATMNVRQVVSILVSYASYHHSITALQVIGLAAVFGALFYKSFSGVVGGRGEAHEKDPLLSKPLQQDPEMPQKAHDAVKS